VQESYPEQPTDPLRSLRERGRVRHPRHNYPPRWNGTPSQELLVIRRNHESGAVSLDPLRWGLIPHWCSDPKGGRKPINAKCETVRDLPTFRGAYRAAPVHPEGQGDVRLPRHLGAVLGARPIHAGM